MTFFSNIKAYFIGAVMLIAGFMFWRTEREKDSLKDKLNEVHEDILNNNNITLEKTIQVNEESEVLEDETRNSVINELSDTGVDKEMKDINKELESSDGTISIKV